MSEILTDTIADKEQKTEKYTGEPGDEDLFSHYARKADIENAILYGVECTALCGKKWFPSRDPEKFPVCPRCKEIYETNEILNDKY